MCISVRSHQALVGNFHLNLNFITLKIFCWIFLCILWYLKTLRGSGFATNMRIRIQRKGGDPDPDADGSGSGCGRFRIRNTGKLPVWFGFDFELLNSTLCFRIPAYLTSSWSRAVWACANQSLPSTGISQFFMHKTRLRKWRWVFIRLPHQNNRIDSKDAVSREFKLKFCSLNYFFWSQ